MSQRHAAEPSALKSYQVAIRPNTDIRNPPAAFVAALAGQFEFATRMADGRMCVTVPPAQAGDDTRDAVEVVLYAAAAHHEASTEESVRVKVIDARFTDDGYCHVLAHCDTAHAMSTPERRPDAAVPAPDIVTKATLADDLRHALRRCAGGAVPDAGAWA
jgi:hypothetical protein